MSDLNTNNFLLNTLSIITHLLSQVLLGGLFKKEEFGFHSKFEGNVESSHIYHLTAHMHSLSLLAAFLIRLVHLFTVDKPTLTHYNHPKSIVYIMAHSLVCIFCVFDNFKITRVYSYCII